MGREFELKYSAEPRQLEKIALAYGDFQKISMETTYYDTPDGKLSRQRITLRRRIENGQSVCTVKTPQTGLTRGEWDIACADIQEAINTAWASEDPSAKKMREELFLQGKPTPEAFIAVLANYAK